MNVTILESINDKYSYAKYKNYKVIVMNENKYINATKLCYENNKRYENWMRNDKSKELIEKVNIKLKKKIQKVKQQFVLQAEKGK